MIAKWLPEEYLKTIVLFELENEKSVISAHGTGVLISYKNVFFIATNKHIVQKPDRTLYKKLYATINKTDGTTSRKDIDAIHAKLGLKWFFHIRDEVDLAISPIAIEQGVEDIRVLTENDFEDFSNIPIGDDIFFLGYPLGLGIKNVPKLSPLVRVGIIALKNSDNTFLLDANVYPGSSGSPVFYKPVLAQQSGHTTNIGTLRPIKLLGLVSSDISSLEEAISKRTGRTRAVFEDNAGLGIAQSASLLKEIFDSADMQSVIERAKKAQEEESKQKKEEEPKA